jgi:hypothetical protein
MRHAGAARVAVPDIATTTATARRRCSMIARTC